MKTYIKSLMALAAPLLFATACTNETTIEPGRDDLSTVTFRIGLDQSLDTRSLNDETGVDILLYQVYDSEGNAVGEQGSAAMMNGEMVDPVSVKLNPGEYNVVFWAQYSDCEIFDTSDLKTVTIDYSKTVNNANNTDAFYNTVSVSMNGENTTENVTLSRPFAQINIGFEENYEDYTQSSLNVSGVYSIFNLIDGTVEGHSEDITFEAGNLPEGSIIIDKNGQSVEFGHVSQTNVLIKNGEKVNMELTLISEGKTNVFNFEDVALKPNFRTNLLGTDASQGATETPEEPQSIEAYFDFNSFEGMQALFPSLPPYQDWLVDGTNSYYSISGTTIDKNNIEIVFDAGTGTGTSIPKLYRTNAGVFDLRILKNNIMIINVPDNYRITNLIFAGSTSTSTQINKLSIVTPGIGDFNYVASTPKTMEWSAEENINVNSIEITSSSTSRIATITVNAELKK